MKFPRSAHDQVGGLRYFPRMLDKIRLHAAGELPPEYQEYLTGGSNQRLCTYLHLDYQALTQRTLAGGTDEEILEWVYQNGRRLNELEVLVWNGFAAKRGWRDEGSELLQKFKEASGLGHRDDIVTFFDYYDVDEKRKA